MKETHQLVGDLDAFWSKLPRAEGHLSGEWRKSDGLKIGRLKSYCQHWGDCYCTSDIMYATQDGRFFWDQNVDAAEKLKWYEMLAKYDISIKPITKSEPIPEAIKTKVEAVVKVLQEFLEKN